MMARQPNCVRLTPTSARLADLVEVFPIIERQASDAASSDPSKTCRLFADVVVQCAGQPFEGGRGDAVRLRVAMRRFRHGCGVFGAGRVFQQR